MEISISILIESKVAPFQIIAQLAALLTNYIAADSFVCWRYHTDISPIWFDAKILKAISIRLKSLP
jgi:hypothetical protein